MRKQTAALLVFLLILCLCAPALATAGPAQTPDAMINPDGSIKESENPNMFWSYVLGIGLFGIIVLSIWVKVKALQNGAGGRR